METFSRSSLGFIKNSQNIFQKNLESSEINWYFLSTTILNHVTKSTNCIRDTQDEFHKTSIPEKELPWNPSAEVKTRSATIAEDKKVQSGGQYIWAALNFTWSCSFDLLATAWRAFQGRSPRTWASFFCRRRDSGGWSVGTSFSAGIPLDQCCSRLRERSWRGWRASECFEYHWPNRASFRVPASDIADHRVRCQ